MGLLWDALLENPFLVEPDWSRWVQSIKEFWGYVSSQWLVPGWGPHMPSQVRHWGLPASLLLWGFQASHSVWSGSKYLGNGALGSNSIFQTLHSFSCLGPSRTRSPNIIWWHAGACLQDKLTAAFLSSAASASNLKWELSVCVRTRRVKASLEMPFRPLFLLPC